MDKHAQRIDIFNSTLDLIGQGWYMASDGSKVKLPPVGEVMAAAKMYSDRFTYFRRDVDLAAGFEFVPTEVRVENKDCVLAAKALIGAGGMMLQPEADITLDKMRTILRIGLDNDHDSLVLSAFGKEANYLRDLPLHASQRELAQGDGYADFEMTLRPTEDFYTPLLARGTAIKSWSLRPWPMPSRPATRPLLNGINN